MSKEVTNPEDPNKVTEDEVDPIIDDPDKETEEDEDEDSDEDDENGDGDTDD